MAQTGNDGLGLFDDAASAAGNFPTALRGYDRNAVDDYVRQLEADAVQRRRQSTGLEQQVRALQDEVARLRDQALPEDAVAKVGGRTGEILSLAEEKAQEIIDSAVAQAEQLKETAQREVEQLRANAQRDAGELKNSGIAEIERLRRQLEEDTRNANERTAAESAAIIASARRQADALREAADHEAQTVRQSAYIETENLRRHTEAEAARVRAEIAGEQEAALATLQQLHDDHKAKIEAMLANAEQHNADSSARLEADIAEAARIRTDALAEAQQVKLAAIKESEERITAAKQEAAAISERTQQEFTWRKQQLKRETERLSRRKQAVLTQLASLSAMAEETAGSFPELDDLDSPEAGRGDSSRGDSGTGGPAADRTVVMPKQQAPDVTEESPIDGGELDEDLESDELGSPHEPAAAGSSGSGR
ncbi:MAG TPA: DivIVA domain-containing protein [Microlunatus sp.]|nr:DivIVA domain-containing protein [Microlunatus sp.]